MLIKAKMILKTKLQKNIVVSIIINNLKVLDKLGSFSNPIFKAINNITTKAKAEIDKHIPNKARVSFLFVFK